MSSPRIMPRLKFKRISIILVTVCFGYWVILYWTSFGFGGSGGGKRHFRPRSDGLLSPQQSFVDLSLMMPGEPSVYSTEYLTQLSRITTPEEQRKYDEGNFLYVLVYFFGYFYSFNSCCFFVVVVVNSLFLHSYWLAWNNVCVQ